MVTVYGRVIGARGEAVWNATVVFRPAAGNGGFPKFGLSDGDGVFEVSGLEPGAYTMVVTQRFYDVHTFLMNVTHDEYIEISLVPDYEHPEIY